jgi:hypothetical protein
MYSFKFISQPRKAYQATKLDRSVYVESEASVDEKMPFNVKKHRLIYLER